MNFGQPYSFIDEQNDKILNYETVYDRNYDIIIDQNCENNKFKEEGIESLQLVKIIHQILINQG